MDHETVAREKMTEKYLLNELDTVARDQFEEHFFNCPDCALDVRAAAELVGHSKIILAETSEGVPARVTPPHPNPDRGRRFAWLRPVFTVPVMALLLAVIGYQNLVTFPPLQGSLHQPQVLPWAALNIGTWGEGGPTIAVPQGKDFLIFVRIPPDGDYVRYTADLYDPRGKLDWSLTIPATAARDQWPVQIPGTNRQAGIYMLAVHGVTGKADSKEIGKASFELQIQR